MTQTIDEQIDELANLYNLSMFLYVVYRETDYTIGVLHFGEPMGDDECPDALVDPPEWLKGGWTWFHEIPMVLHPNKGALLLRKISDSASPDEMATTIEETYSKLTNLEWKIRRRLERLGYWNNRPFTMGAGVVTTTVCPPEARPVSVPEAAIIDRDGITEFPDRIDRLFDHYTTESARPTETWGDRLVEDLTGSSGLLGNFIDRESIAESYHDWGPDLEQIVDSAA